MGEARAEHRDIRRIEVVAVGVRDEAVTDVQKIDSVLIDVVEGVGGKIDQKRAVDDRLRAGPKRASADLTGAYAAFAAAPEGGIVGTALL